MKTKDVHLMRVVFRKNGEFNKPLISHYLDGRVILAASDLKAEENKPVAEVKPQKNSYDELFGQGII